MRALGFLRAGADVAGASIVLSLMVAFLATVIRSLFSATPWRFTIDMNVIGEGAFELVLLCGATVWLIGHVIRTVIMK